MQLEIQFQEKTPGILEGLNENQHEAVTHKDGPLLIIAGAGTGKTTVLARRIAYIIEQKWAKPSEILALTFTEKAAAEMEERVDQLVPYGYVDMWISTFHAFGESLLRDYSIEMGLPSHYKLLTETEQAIFMNDNLYTFDLKYYRPLGNPTSHVEAILSHFSRLKDELITPEEYLKFSRQRLSSSIPPLNLPLTKGEKQGKISLTRKEGDENTKSDKAEAEKMLELANAYARYNELMLQAGNLDFGDLIFLTHKLLKENPKILAECRKKFKYILVDEYQDTNYAQNEIVKLLANEHGNITVVGDDDQSVYRFRGASISNILDFKETYPDAHQIVLTENYRSTQEVLNCSYKLIQHNNPDRLEVKNKINKRLITARRGETPELLHFETLSSEADGMAQKILELKKTQGYAYNDFAILVRANDQAEPFMQALQFAGIPFVFSGASNLFDRPEIKMLIAFLRALVDPNDHLSLYTLATSELYEVPARILSEYYIQAKKTNRSVPAIIESQLAGLVQPNEKLQELARDVRTYQKMMEKTNAGEILYGLLESKDYLKKLVAKPSIENELKIKNIAKFFDRVTQFNHAAQNKNAVAFVESLTLLQKVGSETAVSELDSDLDAVNVLTVHAGKGLEWRVVFIVNAVSDRFPSRKRREQLPVPNELIREQLPEGDFHLEEERRLFYVAATRAKDRLFLTFAEDCGGKRKKKLSRFALELFDDPHPEKSAKKLSALEKIARFRRIEAETMELPYRFAAEKIRLSRLQVDDYYTCPKKFYFGHIVRIPLMENHALMYGTAIHSAINRHLGRRIRQEEASLDQLLLDFRAAFHSVGFISLEHEERRYKAGLETLKRFYAENMAEADLPSALETSFVFTVGNTSINGRYDAIYGEGESVEIRDFKTSDVKTQEDADRRIKESTQMMLYALAWHENHKIIPKTTLYFIESGISGETVFGLAKLEETRRLITNVVLGIKKNEMEAKPNIFACTWCAFRGICPDSIAR
ncbi:MAG: ATP-dependent DNA helicase [Patescibacteria group bacterium]